MTSDTRLSIDEQPPPYTETTSSSDNRKAPSVAESLPEYAALPARTDKKSTTSTRKKKHRRRIYIFSLVLAVIIAGILAGILSTRSHESSTSTGPQQTRRIPPIAALAATECDAATIVIYQDDVGDIYLQGSLKNATWNGTASPYIPASKIVPNSQEAYQDETELSVVCYGGSNSSSSVSLTVHVFYLTNVTFNASIWASTSQILYGRFPDSTPLRIQSNREVIHLGWRTSMTVVYVSGEVRLFFLWDSLPHAKLIEMWSTNTTYWVGPYSLNATAYSEVSALSAIVNSQAQTSVFFMDQDRQLARYNWGADSWNPVTKILTPSNEPLTNISRLACVASYTDAYANIQQSVYYLENGRPQEAIISENVMNHIITTTGPSSSQDWLDGVDYPDLIAAAADVKGMGVGQRIQVFYVGSSDNRTIVNETVWTDNSGFGLRA